MRITAIEKQKLNPGSCNIFIDNEFRLSASLEDIIKNHIKVGMSLTEDSLDELIEICEYSKAYGYSLRLMERKDYTSYELEGKLRQKSFSDAAIIKVLDKLKSIGFVNDEKFSDRYINDALNIRKYGMRKISYNLKNKGITQEQINLIEVDPEIEYKNAYVLAEKKYKLIGDSPKTKEKLFRYLVNKGYEFDIVKKVIGEILNNCEEF